MPCADKCTRVIGRKQGGAKVEELLDGHALKMTNESKILLIDLVNG